MGSIHIFIYIYIHIDIYFLPGELCLHIQVEDLKISADKSDEDMIIHMLYSIFFFFSNYTTVVGIMLILML